MFEPVKFFYLARELHYKGGEDSSYYRTSINRAYYASHLIAKTKAKITSNGRGCHIDTVKYYRKKDKKLGNQLNDLFCRRCDADYNLHKSFTGRDSGLAIQMAEEILKKLKVEVKPRNK